MSPRESYLLEQPTRREILIRLKKQGTLSVQEMARQVGITEMGVRRHLHALQRDQYVRTTICRPSAGRPSYLYSLTDKASVLFVNSYDSLVTELLDEMTDMSGASSVSQLFERRKAKLRNKYMHIIGNKKLEDRVAALTQFQNEEGYMAGLTKSEDGCYLLEEANCPVFRVASRYPQVCQCELSLFEEVLQAPVERLECMSEGGRKCLYRIGKKDAANLSSEEESSCRQ